MTIAEILAEIDEKYPNALDTTSKLRKASYLQKRLYRKMRKQTFLSFNTITDQAAYPLSVNIDDIFQVEVGSSITNNYYRYNAKKINDTSTDRSRYYSTYGDVAAGDWIEIYPTPTPDQDTIVIWYYEQPAELTVDGPSPTLDPDYHMLFVYYVCKEIAENYRDYDIAAGLAIQYDAMEKEMLSTQQDPEVILVHSESGW